jgi:hypothetical protein
MWKCDNETPYIVELICANKKCQEKKKCKVCISPLGYSINGKILPSKKFQKLNIYFKDRTLLLLTEHEIIAVRSIEFFPDLQWA